jgi:hypothetical protein
MLRALKTTALGLTLGTASIFLAGLFSWGYYSTSLSSRVLSLVFSWPYFVAQAALPESVAGTVAILLNYGFYILLSWLLLRFFRRPAKAAA